MKNLEETVRTLAAIKNPGGENPTDEDILRLATKIQQELADVYDDKRFHEISQLVADILNSSSSKENLLWIWDQLDMAIDNLYSQLFLSTDTTPMTLQDVAENLHKISQQIDEESSPKDIQDAGSRVIGQTLANLAIDTNLYVADYPVLDDIISSALSIGSGDGVTEDYFYETWQELVGCIEKFYKEVMEEDSQR